MTEELSNLGDSMLAKYLTAQSGYMALILLVLVPFFKTMLLSDFSATVPLENIITTLALVAMLSIANFKDKKQEHDIASASLTNPKIVERNFERMEKLATANAILYADAVKSLQPQVIEKIVEVEKIVYEPVDRIVYVQAEKEPEMVWSEPENITEVPRGPKEIMRTD